MYSEKITYLLKETFQRLRIKLGIKPAFNSIYINLFLKDI